MAGLGSEPGSWTPCPCQPGTGRAAPGMGQDPRGSCPGPHCSHPTPPHTFSPSGPQQLQSWQGCVSLTFLENPPRDSSSSQAESSLHSGWLRSGEKSSDPWHRASPPCTWLGWGYQAPGPGVFSTCSALAPGPQETQLLLPGLRWSQAGCTGVILPSHS